MSALSRFIINPLRNRVSGSARPRGEYPRLVLLGTGWSAMSFIQNIDTTQYRLAIVSPTNYFVFTPFLPCATTGTIEPSHVIEPVRRVVRRYGKEADYFEARAEDIDFGQKIVSCVDPNKPAGDPSRTFQLPYDHLVIAMGAENNTFNTKGVREYACFLKTLDDARVIKTRILRNFEQACLPSTSEEERQKLLHFVIVGGGPTGVEFAAELHDYVHDDLSKYFGDEIKRHLRISIVEGTDHILNAFDREIAKYAESKFRRNGVKVVTNTIVTEVTPDTIVLSDAKTKQKRTELQGLVVWATGIVTRPAVQKLMGKLPAQHTRALPVDGHLTVRGCDSVYAMGDCSTIKCEKLEALLEGVWDAVSEGGGVTLARFQAFVQQHQAGHPQLEFLAGEVEQYFAVHDVGLKGKLDKAEFTSLLRDIDAKITALPATAQVAAQQGSYLAQRLNKLRDPDFRPLPFTYNHLGAFAYVGQNEVVYTCQAISMKGGAAFWGRNTAYISKMFSWESKRNIAWDLLWSKWFGRDISHI